MAATSKIDKTLSDDAKCVLGGWFGMGPKTIVTLHLVENKPTARTQAALDELVAAKVLKSEPYNRFGGIVYTPEIDTSPYLAWLSRNSAKGRWPLMEPVRPTHREE